MLNLNTPNYATVPRTLPFSKYAQLARFVPGAKSSYFQKIGNASRCTALIIEPARTVRLGPGACCGLTPVSSLSFFSFCPLSVSFSLFPCPWLRLACQAVSRPYLSPRHDSWNRGSWSREDKRATQCAQLTSTQRMKSSNTLVTVPLSCLHKDVSRPTG